VERNRNLKDFFLMLEIFDPHEPFDPPFPYSEMYNPGYTGQRFIWPTYGGSELYSPDELKEIRALYAGEVSLVDHWLGHLLDKVERLGLMDDTMIIVTTDHGHLFGEHGMIGKPWSDLGDSNMYQELAHVPLLIYHPKGQAGGEFRTWSNRWICLPRFWMVSTSLCRKEHTAAACSPTSSTLARISPYGKMPSMGGMANP